ncbi:MAG: 30S ribosomal protein S2 [Bacilli bacterium]|nr:30S ribosomal protein S2 [Bacilli bacterium]MCQ2794027.1 30S ribosomal protein S2 [Bacilli bacterium]
MSENKEEKVVTEQPAEESAVVVEHDTSLPIITMKKCLEAGCHYGHTTRKWNPKMSKYIYGARNGIYIIDLNKTVEKVIEAYIAMRDIVREGGKVLFVGTKEQIEENIVEEALRSGSFYITNRWLGGTLTNFRTIQNRIRYLKDLERKEEDGTIAKLSKKEQAEFKKEKEKLSKNLEGIKEMRRIPQAIFISDPTEEANAVREAKKLGIKIFGIVDTNTDPDGITYPIPANDDAAKSVKLILSVIADAIVEAKGGVTMVAYTKDEGEEVTMKDAIRIADKEAAEKLALIRAARRERQERYEKMRQEHLLKESFKHRLDDNKVVASSETKKAAPIEKKEEAKKESK